MSKIVINNLEKLLKEKSLSQSELVKLTNIRAASINEMYHNKTVRLNLRNLAKICEVLNCEIYEVLELKEPI